MSGNSHNSADANRKIRRFERSEVILHWVNAVPFLILLLTGALNILTRFKIYSAPFIESIRIMHKISGVIWIVGIGYSFFFIGRELNIANTSDQIKISSYDITWAVKTMRSLFDRNVEVPPVGKFNIGQKSNALLVILYVVAFAGSGAFIWAYKTMLFPWYFHTALFFMAVFSLSGHLYLSFIHPSTRPGLIGIFNGMVPRSYIAHHHALMIEDSVNAHQPTTALRGVTKTNKAHQEPQVPVFHHALRNQDHHQEGKYRHVEKISADQSRYADVRAHDSPEARLIAAWYGSSNNGAIEKISADQSRRADAHADADVRAHDDPEARLAAARHGSRRSNKKSVEKISADRSRRADAHADADVHAHDDPEARLIAAWYGNPGSSDEKSDAQKAWGSISHPRRKK